MFLSCSFLPCSEKICLAVTEMAALFPKVRWLPTAAQCHSPKQMRVCCFFKHSQREKKMTCLYGVSPSHCPPMFTANWICLVLHSLRQTHRTYWKHFIDGPLSWQPLIRSPIIPSSFPSQRPSSETVRGSLCLLTSSASRLHGECHKAVEHNPCPADIQLVTQQVIQCAYDIAKAAKQLVTVTTKENNN